MQEKIKKFIDEWKEEMRERVQPIVESGKRKPLIAVVRLEGAQDSGMVDLVKELGFAGDLYEIPLSSGITQKDLFWMPLETECDEMYIEEPLPEGFYDPYNMTTYVREGLLKFLKSQNISPQAQTVVLTMVEDGYTITVGDITITKEEVDALIRMGVLSSAVDCWKSEIADNPN